MARGQDEVVVIDIDKNGGTKVTVEGVKGDGCSLLSRDIVKALGGVESDTPTDEMYEAPVTDQQVYQ